MNEIAAANLDPQAMNTAELAKVIAAKSELTARGSTRNAIAASTDAGFTRGAVARQNASPPTSRRWGR